MVKSHCSNFSITTAIFQVLEFFESSMYRKTPKSLDSRKFAVIPLTFEQGGFTIE